LIANGVFLMDTVDTSTEATLATETLSRVDGDDLRVLIGGLGLGFTLAAVLDDGRVGRVDVVELEGALVDWLRAGLVPGAARSLADPRVWVHVGDVADVAPVLPNAFVDAVLLDIDNGPTFLVHQRNEVVYAAPFLSEVARCLRPAGVLAMWSSEPSPVLAAVLAETVGPCEQVLVTVCRDGHELTYALYLARRAGPVNGSDDAPATVECARRIGSSPPRSAPATAPPRQRT
jgi:spermidine synthase